VSYETWPSLDLHVELQRTDWPAPAAQQTIDGQETSEGTSRTIEPNNKRWGLVLENGADDPSPSPLDRTYKEAADSNDPTSIRSFAPPPLWGSHAMQDWQAAPPRQINPPPEWRGDTRFSDPRTIHGEQVSSGVEVPPISVEGAYDDGTERIVYGAVRVPRDGSNAIQFIETFDHPDEGVTYAVFCQEPDQASLGNSAPTLAHSAAWARSPYQQQGQRRVSHREVDGRFTGIDWTSLSVGDATTLLSYEGTSWMPWKARRNVVTERSSVVLRHPFPIGLRPEMPVRPSVAGAEYPVRTGGEDPYTYEQMPWVVVNPRAEYRTIERGDGKEDWALFHWERSQTQYAREFFYHLQIKDNTLAAPRWVGEGEDWSLAPDPTPGQTPVGDNDPVTDAAASAGDMQVTVACDSDDEVHFRAWWHAVAFESHPTTRYVVGNDLDLSAGETGVLELHPDFESGLDQDVLSGEEVIGLLRIARTYSTAFVRQQMPAGSGGESPSGDDIIARVRPALPGQVVGEWSSMQVAKDTS
jgi:hypothetical protein